jgi:predicted nucleotidyltransferase
MIAGALADIRLGGPENMQSRDDILTDLLDLKADLSSQYKVCAVGVFGSLVHDNQHDNSDIDLLVDFDGDASMFDLVRLGLFLETRWGCKVDIVPRESVRTELRDAILDDAIYV